MSRAKVERAAEATIGRLKAAGAFTGTDEGLRGEHMDEDDARVNLLFVGMDVDPARLRQHLDLMADEHLRVLMTANATQGGLTPEVLAAALRGLTYQAALFGWELAQ